MVTIFPIVITFTRIHGFKKEKVSMHTHVNTKLPYGRNLCPKIKESKSDIFIEMQYFYIEHSL
jgi:hypothetical protein